MTGANGWPHICIRATNLPEVVLLTSLWPSSQTSGSLLPSQKTPRLSRPILILIPPCCYQRRSEACSHWLILAEASGCTHDFQPQIQNFTYNKPHKFAYFSGRYGRYSLHSGMQYYCVCEDKSPHVQVPEHNELENLDITNPVQAIAQTKQVGEHKCAHH